MFGMHRMHYFFACGCSCHHTLDAHLFYEVDQGLTDNESADIIVGNQ